MGQRLFILEGNGTSRNRGCQAIFRATVRMLRDEFGPCRFVNAPAAVGEREQDLDISRDVVHVLPQPVVRWRPRWIWRKLRHKVLGREPAPSFGFTRYLQQADAVLAVGGDNFSLDYGRPDRFFHAADLAWRASKPFILWGASVGPFSADPPFERLARERLARMTLICARESETVRYLAGLGIEANVVAVADPAFLLEPQRPELPANLEAALDARCLGLNLSGLMARYRPDPSRWIDEATDWVRALAARTDLPIVLVPHVIHPRDDDHRFLAEIHRRVGLRGRLTLVSRDYDAQQLKWIISRCGAFIGARTHATVAALSSGVPTLSIGYSMKARGINLDIFDHTDYLLPIDTLSADSLTSAARHLLKDADSVRRQLAEVMPGYADRAREGVRQLAHQLDGRPSDLKARATAAC